MRFNTDVVFVDGSGQVRTRNGSLTLRADDTGLADIIVGSGASLRPEVHSAIDLGTEDLRWRFLYTQVGVSVISIPTILVAQTGVFTTRPIVNGSGVLLQGEVPSQAMAEYYLNANAGAWTTTLTTVPLDTTAVQDSSHFSRAGGVVTVGVAGWYRVSYSASVNQTGGNSRSVTRHEVTLNGTTAIPQSVSWLYSRNNSSGEGTVSKTFLVQLGVSDNIRIRSQRHNGGGTFTHLAGSHLSIEFVRPA